MESVDERVQAYLETLPGHRNIRQAPKAPSRTFTMSKPHGCSHCQRNIVDSRALTVCQTFCLEYNAKSAIVAAESGCAFYEWLLEFWSQYCLGFNTQEHEAIYFSLIFRPPGKPTVVNILIEAVCADGRREERNCWPNPQLLVSATEG
jgi:hypothetical protein